MDLSVSGNGAWATVRDCLFLDGWSLIGAGIVGLMSLGAYLFANKSRGSLKLLPDVDLQDQTKPNTQEEGRVTRLLKDGQLVKYQYEDAQTVYEAFRRGARESASGDALGYRRPDGDQSYEWISYKTAISRSESFAAGLFSKGLKKGSETYIGIYSQNRPEWILTEQACYHFSQIVVPLYDTLGIDACTYIINKMGMEVVICDTSGKVEGLLKQKDRCPCLRLFVVMEKVSESAAEMATQKGVEVLRFSEVEELGRQQSPLPEPQPPQPTDLATVCFTSGTTGTPKGVILTHANVIADCTPMLLFKHISLSKEDVMISYLPLAHMFERILETTMYLHGGSVGFFRGDVRLLTEDIKALRPTFVPAVPRVLNRVYDKVMAEAGKSRIKKFLLDWGLRSKVAELKKSVVRNDSIWDRWVFNRVREGMGGRVKLVICGSAPLAENVLTFMRAALGCIILEGYGQTECVAAATVTLEGDHEPGHVGTPIPCCMIKLVDVAEMNCFAAENKGEICIKGYNVSPGYFEDPEKTREAFDADGWLHTGDIGQWTSRGTLKVIDRKKHIFKLAQGEYIAPEKIENVYLGSRFVAQVFVYGQSLKSCVVAIIVPDPEILVKFAEKELGLGKKSMEELCKEDSVKRRIMEDMTKVGKEGRLNSFEQVKDIHLYPALFTVDNNFLTPTLKSKRPELASYFSDDISRMYSSLI